MTATLHALRPRRPVPARLAVAVAAACLTTALGLAAAVQAVQAVRADEAPAADTAAASGPAAVVDTGSAPAVTATEAIVVDGDGNVLYALNANTRMSMASITKVMTAVVALESGIPLDTPWTITDSVSELDPVSSVVGYQPGDRTTLGEMLHGLLVHSGNDAALSIAECVAGTEEAFVEMMNAKAAELGLDDTHFENSHGLDAYGHYSTPSDLVELGRYAMRYPLFASIVGSTATEIAIGGVPTRFTATDALLNSYPGMRGIKTGTTAGAGEAFLGLATRGGVSLYVVVLGCASDADRWADTRALLDWGFAQCGSEQVASADASAVAGYLPFADRFGWSVSTSVSADGTLLSSPFDQASAATVEADVAPVATGTGTEAGTIVWSDGGSTVLARTVTTGDGLVATAAFGPFVSDVFYGSSGD